MILIQIYLALGQTGQRTGGETSSSFAISQQRLIRLSRSVNTTADSLTFITAAGEQARVLEDCWGAMTSVSKVKQSAANGARSPKPPIHCASVCVFSISSQRVMHCGYSLYLPEAAGAAQVAEVSVGGHPVVGLAAQNDGGCRRDWRRRAEEC